MRHQRAISAPDVGHVGTIQVETLSGANMALQLKYNHLKQNFDAELAKELRAKAALADGAVLVAQRLYVWYFPP